MGGGGRFVLGVWPERSGQGPQGAWPRLSREGLGECDLSCHKHIPWGLRVGLLSVPSPWARACACVWCRCCVSACVSMRVSVYMCVSMSCVSVCVKGACALRHLVWTSQACRVDTVPLITYSKRKAQGSGDTCPGVWTSPCQICGAHQSPAALSEVPQ